MIGLFLWYVKHILLLAMALMIVEGMTAGW